MPFSGSSPFQHARIIARKVRGTQVLRTHPLCAYQMTAWYNGAGSTDDAANFQCR